MKDLLTGNKIYRVWTCTDYTGTSAVSVIVAETPAKACKLLAKELEGRNLDPTNFTLQELHVDGPAVRFLQRPRKVKAKAS